MKASERHRTRRENAFKLLTNHKKPKEANKPLSCFPQTCFQEEE
jgi:hypothetical protein